MFGMDVRSHCAPREPLELFKQGLDSLKGAEAPPGCDADERRPILKQVAVLPVEVNKEFQPRNAWGPERPELCPRWRCGSLMRASVHDRVRRLRRWLYL